MKLLVTAVAGVLLSAGALGQGNLTKPQLVMHRSVEGMPRGSVQEVSVLTAEFKPGDKTVFHTHRFPVTVYVLEGAFTLQASRGFRQSSSKQVRPMSSRPT